MHNAHVNYMGQLHEIPPTTISKAGKPQIQSQSFITFHLNYIYWTSITYSVYLIPPFQILVYPYFSNQLPVPDDPSTNSYYSLYEHPEYYDSTTSTTSTKKPLFSLSGWKDKFQSVLKYIKKNNTKTPDEKFEHEMHEHHQGTWFFFLKNLFKFKICFYVFLEESELIINDGI